MKTYDELKQEQKPAGTFDCYTSHRIGDFTKTCIVTIFQWEQVPRSKSKTRVPRYKSLIKAKCDRENQAWQSRLIQNAVDALNAGTAKVEDLPKSVNSQRAWREMALMLNVVEMVLPIDVARCYGTRCSIKYSCLRYLERESGDPKRNAYIAPMLEPSNQGCSAYIATDDADVKS